MEGFRLQEKTALLVGPAGRTVQALAQTLTQLGCDVVLGTDKPETLTRFAAQLSEACEVNEKFGRAAVARADVKNKKDAQDLVSKAAEFFGGMDILIDANLHVSARTFSEGIDELDSICDLNLRSTLLTTHAVLPFLKGRKKGRIFYLLDGAIQRGVGCDPLAVATRSSLIAFSKSLAAELSEFQITVNCVEMSLTEEFLLATAKEGLTVQAMLQTHRVRDPRAQITDPDKAAAMVAFLASQLGSAISGQCITVGV